MSSLVTPQIDPTPAGIPPGFEDLVASAPFKKLTRQQKVWVLEYLSNGQDAIAAARVAYPSALPHSQVCISYQVCQSPLVQDALEFWKWRSPRETLIAICRQQLKAAEPGSTAATTLTVQLERLSLGVKGTNKAHFVDPDAPGAESEVDESEPAPKFKTGDRITQRDLETGVEHVGIVRSLDADGLPAEIEEVL
jgi:hypothetical protein